MRMMLRWSVPAERGNQMVADGSMGTVLETLLEKTQAEAAYFLPVDGDRGGILFFDMKEPADIARTAEILFQGADAVLDFTPVMNWDDLQKALASL